MHLICNCQSGGVEESAETWTLATSGSAGPRQINFPRSFFTFENERASRCTRCSKVLKLERAPWRRGISTWNFDLLTRRRIHLETGLNLFPTGREGGYPGLAIGSVSQSRLVAIRFALVAVVCTGVQGNFLGWLCHVFRLTVWMIILGFLNQEGEVGVFEDTEEKSERRFVILENCLHVLHEYWKRILLNMSSYFIEIYLREYDLKYGFVGYSRGSILEDRNKIYWKI